jgi:hypothetical protein
VTPRAMRLSAAAAVLAALLAPALSAGAVEVLVRPADAEELRGALTGMDQKTLLVVPEGGAEQKFDVADLMGLEFAAAAAPAGEGCAHLYTVTGDIIPAKIEAEVGGKVSADSPWVGKFEISSKALRGVVMPAGLKDARVRAEVAKSGRRRDKVFLLNNDEMEGSFEGLAGGTVKFKSDLLGAMDSKLDDILGIAFAELDAKKPSAGTYCMAEFAGGGHVFGHALKLDGEGLRWRTLDGVELRLLLSAVAAIRVRSGRLIYLSELRPDAVDELPFVEGLPFVWKYRIDADSFGKPLVLGGVRFRRGLGVAACTKLTYKLEGAGYKRFKASVGVSDSAAAGGKTAFRVLVDGKEAFVTKALLTKGVKPVNVDVSVEKAKELTLVIDFGDDSDLGDMGGWGDARLVK